MVLGSKELIRDINSKLVLETILHNEPISRAAISKKLGLTKATISAIVSDFINDKLVVEIGSDDTLLGRKPILLSFHKKAGYAICVDIEVSRISCMISDLKGEQRSVKQIKTPEESRLVPVLIDLIQSMESEYEKTPYGLVGIAIGIHGVVHQNEVLFTPYYNLSSINLSEQLGSYFGVPVFLENEANLSALGEKAFLPETYTSLANLSIHSGVGLGIILNKQLYTGYHGNAGEFGHTIVVMNGRSCPCGNHGCLEQYASERALLKDFREDATLDEFFTAYDHNDQKALAVMENFINYMAVCVNNLQNTISPEIIIINSAFTNAYPELTVQITRKVSNKLVDKIPLIASNLKDHSILLGGITILVKNFLGIKNLNLTTKSPL